MGNIVDETITLINALAPLAWPLLVTAAVITFKPHVVALLKAIAE